MLGWSVGLRSQRAVPGVLVSVLVLLLLGTRWRGELVLALLLEHRTLLVAHCFIPPTGAHSTRGRAGPTPTETAAIAACVRFVTLSLRKTAARCAFTVFSDRNSAREMSRLLLPSASSARMSVSRWVSEPVVRRGASPLSPAVPPLVPSNRFWITLGESTLPPPDIATLIACSRASGVASFNM